MKTRKFSDYKPGIVSDLLHSAYSRNQDIVKIHSSDWKEFDKFIYENLSFMDFTGFISEIDNKPIGFMSWDPRLHPQSVEIGHNCIINDLQGQKLGKEQLLKGLKIISVNRPETLIVKTGNIDFFIPAQKMYESAGFVKQKIIRHNDPVVPEIILYSMKL